ncbi:hypothetical protein [Synechococcus sp. OH20]|uniref:hypothetical protein n=1 Tax=Synechococcus sp. OH20 TaxID=139337 RepID=UPI0039C6827E
MGVRLGEMVGATATGGGVDPLAVKRGGKPPVVSLLQAVASASEAQVARRERPPRPGPEPERRFIGEFSTHSHHSKSFRQCPAGIH